MTRESALSIWRDARELASAVAELFVGLADAAVAARGRFTVALAGGATPNTLYELLAADYRGSPSWQATHVFWGDERHVPPDHQDSNFRAAFETLLRRVAVPREHVHRIRGELPNAADAAADYELTLRRAFALGETGVPVFDLVLLGMGTDGHTASLFPDNAALHERDRLVLAAWVPQMRTLRVTLTLPVFNSASAVVFLVSGAEKAEALRAVLEGPDQPVRLPAQAVHPSNGQLQWFVDAAAASGLKRGGINAPA